MPRAPADEPQPLPDGAVRAAALVAELADVVYVLQLEPTLAFEYLSESVVDFVGFTAKDHFADPQLIWRMLDPRDQAAAGAARDAPIGVRMDFEVRYVARDGSTMWTLHRCRKDRREDGSVVLCGVARDVTAERQVRERYRLLVDNSTDVVMLSDRDRMLAWVSPNVSAALGWTAAELMRTRLVDLVHPQDVEAAEAMCELVTGSQGPRASGGMVLRLRRGDGTYSWMSIRSQAVTDDAGAPNGFVCGVRDVDDLVGARERAELDRARLRATVDSLIDPHVLLAAVRGSGGGIVDFEYVEANQAACAFVGRTREGTIGATLLDAFPGEEGAAMVAMYSATLLRGTPLVADDFQFPSSGRLRHRRYDIRAIRVNDGLSLTWRDVTDRYQTVRALAASEEEFRLLAENSSDVVLHIRDGQVLWASPSLTGTLGWSPAEWIGHEVYAFYHPDDVERGHGQELPGDQAHGDVMRVRLRARDGTFHWVESHREPYVAADGSVDGIVASCRIVDENVAVERQLHLRATFDELTGLVRREVVLSRLTSLAGRSRRRGDETAIAYCDVDDFKDINDTRGHAAGDEVLRVLADRMRRAVRSNDTVARMGGDEFLIVLDAVGGIEEATAIARKVRDAAGRPIHVGAGSVVATMSVGVALATPGEDVDALIGRADDAMYRAKALGPGRVEAEGPSAAAYGAAGG